ncbi:undecaprenyldiphospho-muramoylpentapeptide beta-N-acetylglucosaminyltransferase [Mogibacterium pumilum]|uniref:UDP-N-acetylglucosamine--N-acetylmuramyl-(pentapeptide) pyrophosphoryl-undecaprenol N-acetylglucosamine transferase n=1 Tax=Mogibacterium pumilum TaxID=86332 RepID=A0A223ASH5_9FIRM|nr:undecaprenyldiphospho-muramoylpentapeptide beta-N-acetylglucosaminyltransferase [Mogibacterium pumilum]ASS37869.1 undecaprenyldiphospho-muramoylpentapeptide beta-N-acetylglucosaminyltransferase [Mogibacterium pumilum]
MRVILTGGITGGHIYPALAIADQFKEIDNDAEFLYLGSDEGMERYIVPKYGYELKYINSRWFDRSSPLKLAKTLFKNGRGKRQAISVMKQFKPDLVMSTGSFVSVPVVLAAKALKIPVYIHEQNAYPGIANKLLSKYARRVFLGFEAARKYFPSEKVVYTGNPVRSEFGEQNRECARDELGIPQNDFVVLIFGGSLGAETINDIGLEIVNKYGNDDNVTILFGTGKDYYEHIKTRLTTGGKESPANVRVMPYISEMAKMLSASNVIICRSGALSTAEVTMAGRAAIFVPSPNVTGDHQYYNAKAVADNGGAVLITENGDVELRVLNALKELSTDASILEDMEEGSFKSAPIDAAKIICEEIISDVKARRK